VLTITKLLSTPRFDTQKQSVALRAPRAPLALENWTSTEFQKH
jgi:hypothetical protein